MTPPVDPNTTVNGQEQGAPPGPVDPMASLINPIKLPEPVQPPEQPPTDHIERVETTGTAEDIGKQGRLNMLQYGHRP